LCATNRTYHLLLTWQNTRKKRLATNQQSFFDIINFSENEYPLNDVILLQYI